LISLPSFFAWLGKKSTAIIVLLAGLILITGIVYAFQLGNSLRFLPDEAEYVTLAKNLVKLKTYSKDGLQPTAYRPPGYPLVLGGLTLLGGDILHFRLLNFFLLAGCIYLVGRILIQQGFQLAAVFGSLLVVAYPVLFYTSGTLYPQTLAAFLFLLILSIFTKDQLSPNDFALGGIFLGLLVLTVPTFLFAILAVWVWFFLSGKYTHVKYFLITLTVVSVMLGIWTIRNYSVFGTFFFVSTNSGENLLIGNSENTTANAGTTVDISSYLTGVAGLGEVERDRYLNQQALNYVTGHPKESLKLYFQKVLNYFNYRNDLVTVSEGSRLRDLLMLVTYRPLIVIFFVRTLAIKYSKPTSIEVLFIVLYIISAFVTAIFFSRIRFRLPFDYLMIMVVAITLERAIKYILYRKTDLASLNFLHS
jgi:hypothetical protein